MLVFMKRLLLAFAAFAAVCFASVVTGCQEKKTPAGEPAGDSLAVDSVKIDSLVYGEEEESEAPMPRAADELFDDFIFNFATNPHLQTSRIDFPIIRRKGERTDTILQQQWETEHFFMTQDFYTLILDDEEQMEKVKDTTVNHAVVEKIYLESGYVTRYIFNRRGGKWMMTAVSDTTWRGTPNGDFLSFYTRFASDTLFQASSIHNPLKFTGPDPDDDFSVMEGLIMPEQWSSFAPDLPRGMMYNIVYGAPAGSLSEKVLLVRGIANGLETELVFRKRDGKWKLTELSI